jgi:aspartyl-tRNA(Asn)/glutamyl-tRNA(Gln) amidotransferase subunit B
VSDTGALAAIVAQVVADNPGQVAEYRGGKDKVLGFFVGQVMKATQGKANPQQVNELLRARSRLSRGGRSGRSRRHSFLC